MTIKRKFGAYLIFVLVALGLVGIVTGRSVRDQQRAQVMSSVEALARLEGRRVEDALVATADDMLGPSGDVALVPVLQAERDRRGAPSGALIATFEELSMLDQSLKAATIVDVDGTPLTSTADLAEPRVPGELDDAFVQRAIQSIQVGARYVVGEAFRVGPADERFLLVTAISFDTRVDGYVVAEIDLAPIQRLLTRSSALGDTAEAHLVQEHGQGAQFISDLRFDSNARFDRVVPFNSTSAPAIVALTSEFDGVEAGLVDYRGESVVSATHSITNTPWKLIVKMDESEAFGGSNRAITLGALAFAAAGAAALLLMVLLFHSILVRMGRISQTAAAISAGDLTVRVADHSSDELGELARAFDRMTDSLVADMARRHEVERRLAYRASHDPLTGLPNRDAFHDGLKRSLADRAIAGSVAVLFCDLDDFKTVNDDLGHSAGDALLIGVASRLRLAMGAHDTLGRFGGDEFVVHTRGVIDRGQVHRLAERMREQLATPLVIGGREVFVTTSIGVAFSRPGSTAETLIRDADAAMYRAKEIGRHRVVLHDETIGARATNRLEMTTELRRVIGRGGLTMALQPIIDVRSGGTRAWEALVRWSHGGQEIDPAEFVTRATELDIAGELDRWVLDQACSLMGRLDGHATSEQGWLHVNVTGTSLVDSDFAADALRVLDRHQIAPSSLCLEIIEDRFAAAPQLAFRTLNELRRHGVHIAIDDFGTGHSSLARLRDLPVDVVKIDQSFVRSIATDPTVEAITGTIIGLTARLGLEAIAEGVEHEDQLERLQALGCHFVQGYLLAPPRPAETVVRLINAG